MMMMMIENSAVSAAKWVSLQHPCLQGSLNQEFGCYDKGKIHTTLCGQEFAGKTDFTSDSSNLKMWRSMVTEEEKK